MPMFSFITHYPATAFLFPGQGSQEVGMGKALADLYPVARQTFAEADAILGFPLSQLCFEGPEAELTDTVNVQPALLAVCVAQLRVLQHEFAQARPTAQSTPATTPAIFVAGHSLGEYTALIAAGSISFADGLRLVRERGRLMKNAGQQQPGMMAAVLGLDEEKVSAICREASEQAGIAVVANDNCPGQIVISGDKAGMEAAISALSAAGARKVVPLAVSVASHSPLMQPAVAELRAAIDATTIVSPVVPLIGNTTAQPITTADEIRAELAAQLTGSVRWTASMQFARAAGVVNFVEIGPSDVLSGLMKRIDRSAERLSLNTPDSIQAYAQQAS